MGRAQAATDLEAVDVGKAEVEHDKFWLRVEDGDFGIATGADPAGRVAGLFQRTHQRTGDRCVVFDQEQRSHAFTLPVLDARI